MEFAHRSFGRRLRTMLAVDFRRMFTTPLIYIAAGSCFVMPVLILVMTTMMDGSVTIDPQTGAETIIEGFDNTWQIIGSVSGAGSMMDMSLTGMCNINMLYFFIAALVCLFVADDFKSGYAKNLFAVRAKKTDYVISKSVVCLIGNMLMILAFFAGSMLGGAVSGLPFDPGMAGSSGIVMCLISKMLLAAMFVPLYLLWSVAARQRLWMSLTGSLCTGMLFFMMIPMLTPLDATIVNVIICLAGGALFSAGFGALSNAVLNRADLV